MDRETMDYEILQCLDKGLGNCGPSIKHAAYWQLLVVFNLKATSIPSQPEKFASAIEKIFGAAGAVMIEREIVKEIASRFGIKRPRSMRFLSVLEEAREVEVVKPALARSSNVISR